MLPAVAIQGFEGSFHQIAARRYFSPEVEVVPCATFGEVVSTVVQGTADAAVMAIENSIAGSILPNYTLLRKSGLRVMGETYLHIRQHLMALPGQGLEDITEVHSHPMALLQCADYLGRHRHWRLVETEDTALSAQRIREGGRAGVAAVAGTLAAELFGLDILEADIHSEKKNYTRFLVVARPENAAEVAQPNKASLYFHTTHAQGSLARVLVRIAEQGINLSKLQSCPKPGGTWHYYFHADLEFEQPEQLQAALRAIAPLTEGLEVLGVYHKGDTH
ncbi:prephenate dehydratase [Hymenobacter luteus]|uniref:prephenate dehydratase n=2 Tax=Hymenobacter TaxID=89966 RepID=A0A7W9SZU7_9BACT|nr:MULTISPECIES: prephenate dehydratase [Hymenobacter]MBB4599432.1 prephenate dehydratase [Hymenobacter latericoloratus]MBB6058259.1 prephenate dehydratase [Hymenobacter luteus]